jgi:hypothetical protein
MTTRIVILACLLLLVTASCGPNQTEIDATKTAISADIFATQTAQAPTATHTPSPTPPLPTDTPEPTATSTPEVQPTPTLPPSVGGWRTYVLESFSIALPEDWRAVDISKQGLAAVEEIVAALDPEMHEQFAGLMTTDILINLITFWAVNPDAENISQAILAKMGMPTMIEADDLLEQMAATTEEMGIPIVGQTYNLEINGMDVARLATDAETEFYTLRQFQYIYVAENDVWFLSLSAQRDKWDDSRETLIEIAESFQEIKEE